MYYSNNSHAIAGGFSPAIATALYTNVGLTAAGLVYVVFGLLSVAGIYIQYCFGGGDKEADTGTETKLEKIGNENESNSTREVEMMTKEEEEASSSADKTSLKNIV